MLDRLQVDYRQARAALDATRTFTADAGHELRTPLTSLRANLEVLARDDLDAADRARSLRDALAAHSRLTALIEGLQTLARGDAAAVGARTEAVELGELADAAVVDARRRHPDVAFEFAGSPVAPVDGDPDGLRMLLDNLLENAAVHGGRQVRVHLAARDGYVRLSVEDDGPGVPDAEKGRVFERFARGSAARNGTGSGLGLAIAAQQAELHGSRIKLEDSPLGGARFELILSARGPS
jgi:signal transduction histidine kinase